MIRKNRVWTGMIALLIVALLAGCSSSKSGTGAEEAESGDGVVTIKLWHNNTSEFLKRKMQEFNDTIGKEKGIHVDFRTMGDYADALKVALAADQGPDLYMFVGTVKDPFINSGWMLPLEDFPQSAEFLKGYEGLIIPEYNTYKDKTYSVPFKVITTKMLYNKRLFEKAGITEVPQTWDEVATAAKKITEAGEGREYGYGTHLKDAGSMGGKWSNAVMFAPSVGHMGYDFTKGEYRFADFTPILEKIVEMKTDKSIFPGAEGMGIDNLRAQFAEGRVGMMMGANWEVISFNDSLPAKDDWGVAHVPVLDPANRYKEYAQVGDFLVFGPAAKKHPDESFAVYEYVHSLDFQRSMHEEGFEFMAVPSVIEGAKMPDKKGWAEFADLSTSYFTKTPPDGAIKLEGDTYQNTIAKILTGSVSDIRKELESLDKRYNDALQRAVNDGFDMKPFIDESLDISW
ncbi:extracellular solute-binding protein [Paenibacillaceae bacterium]|nr:extracellular solute-binding protein [Paenibacillaceae bacterium]